MKRKLGILCILLGCLMLLGAGALYGSNELESLRAERSSRQAVEQLQAQILELKQEPAGTAQGSDEPEEPRMTVVEIDGYGYIGYVSIPRLKLELPVMDQWDETRLKTAPCRYAGTTMGDDLVIMAHNYRKHFGPIRRLKVGDEVSFVDMDGISTLYHVAATDVVSANAVEEVTANEYDLTLFTCTYGGKTRVVVYCSRAVNADMDQPS